MTTYTYTTQKQIRAAFREQNPNLDFSRYSKDIRYCADTRMAFCDFIESLARNNQISDTLAHRATL